MEPIIDDEGICCLTVVIIVILFVSLFITNKMRKGGSYNRGNSRTYDSQYQENAEWGDSSFDMGGTGGWSDSQPMDLDSLDLQELEAEKDRVLQQQSAMKEYLVQKRISYTQYMQYYDAQEEALRILNDKIEELRSGGGPGHSQPQGAAGIRSLIPDDFQTPVEEMGRERLMRHAKELATSLRSLREIYNRGELEDKQFDTLERSFGKRKDEVVERLKAMMHDPKAAKAAARGTVPSAGRDGMRKPKTRAGPGPAMPKKDEPEKTVLAPYIAKLDEWEAMGLDMSGLRKLAANDPKEFVREFSILRKQLEG